MSKKIAILLGTSNQQGNTAGLVSQLLEQDTSHDYTVFDLLDHKISPFDYDHHNIGDDFIGLIEQLLRFDTIVFATPVYWYAMSGQMKIFFDRISDLLHVKKDLGRQLRGKNAVVISTGASPQPERSFEEVFINSFDYLGMNYLGMLYCYCEQNFSATEHQADIDDWLKSHYF